MRRVKETAARFENLENVQVSNRPEATAGPGKLLAFPTEREEQTMALPPRLAGLARKGMVDLVTLTGNSLEGIGIYDGDQVLCKTAFSRKEIKANTICIVYLPDTGETLAKKVIYRKNTVVLKSFHPNVEDMELQPEQVQVQGIVLRLLRRPDDEGRFDRRLPDSRISLTERKSRISALVKRFEKPEKKEDLPF